MNIAGKEIPLYLRNRITGVTVQVTARAVVEDGDKIVVGGLGEGQ
jgi:hypothetical protein